MPVRYVPILKGKEGEYGALNELDPALKGLVMPLIEVPPVPRDWERDRPAKSLEDHVAGVADRITSVWGENPIYVDFPWFVDQEHFGDGRSAMDYVLGTCRRGALHVVPVLHRLSSEGHIEAAKRHHAECNRGVCLRLVIGDFSDDVEIEADIDQILRKIEITRDSVDVILDVKRQTDPDSALLVVRYIKSGLPYIGEWRRVILAASSFPQDLSEVTAQTITRMPRSEWQLWERVIRRPERSLRSDVIFGDYAIAHPEPRELDPRMMRMSASIRYTTPAEWLVLKGRNVRQWGFEQFYELCDLLMREPEYRGEDYSWGDAMIARCARKETGTGNATTWRKVATNHHITLVAKALATPAEL